MGSDQFLNYTLKFQPFHCTFVVKIIILLQRMSTSCIVFKFRFKSCVIGKMMTL